MAPSPLAPARSAALDYLTRMTGKALDAPLVCVSLVDANRRLLISTYGLTTLAAVLLSWPFAKRLAPSGAPMLVADAVSNPLVARIPSVRDGAVAAFAGMRLVDPAGRAVGTLAVMDRNPREWSRSDVESLSGIASLILRKMDGGSAVGPTERELPVFRRSGARRPERIPHARAAKTPGGR